MDRKLKRKIRTRSKLFGSKVKPRLSVHRSNKHIFAQLIDDEGKVTIFSVSEKNLKEMKANKTEKAKALGILLSEKAKSKKITEVVFDRGSYAYHGRIKALAEGAREGGLKF